MLLKSKSEVVLARFGVATSVNVAMATIDSSLGAVLSIVLLVVLVLITDMLWLGRDIPFFANGWCQRLAVRNDIVYYSKRS
jgi:hypothetical protein